MKEMDYQWACPAIKKLQNGTEIIAGGNLDHRIDIHTGDEIEQLAKSFNIMGKKLKGVLHVPWG